MTTTEPHATETTAEGFVLPAPAAPAPRPTELAESLVEQAQADGVELVGPGGLLGDLTKKVLGSRFGGRARRAPRLREARPGGA